jgi:hypothetical protein
MMSKSIQPAQAGRKGIMAGGSNSQHDSLAATKTG